MLKQLMILQKFKADKRQSNHKNINKDTQNEKEGNVQENKNKILKLIKTNLKLGLTKKVINVQFM